MKIKTPYIYLAALIVILTVLIIITQSEKNIVENKSISGEMPNDEIHRNLQNQHGQVTVNEETKKMMEEYEKALKENPKDTVKIREYADFLIMAHKIDEAIKYYERILSIDKKRKDILINLATIFYNKGDLDKATQFTNDILKLDKKDLTAIYNLGVIEATRGNHDAARKYWGKIVKEFPNSEIASIAKESLESLDSTK